MEENCEDDVGGHEVNNSFEETHTSNTVQSSSRNSHEQAQGSHEVPMNSDAKPLLNEVVIRRRSTRKKSGWNKDMVLAVLQSL